MMVDRFPDTAFHAPNAPVSIGEFGFIWYDMDIDGGREEGLKQVSPVVDRFIDDLLMRYGLPASRCALVGFSQGTILSIHLAPRRKVGLAGVVGFSGAMFSGDSLSAEIASKSPFVLVHGDRDSILDYHQTETAADRLQELGVSVEVHILPGLAHSIDQRGLDIGMDFLTRVFA